MNVDPTENTQSVDTPTDASPPIPVEETTEPAPLPPSGKPRIWKFLRTVSKSDASDLHLKSGSRARLRVGGHIKSIKGGPLENDEVESMIYEIMHPQQIETYKAVGSMDFAYEMEGEARFRINVFRQRGLTSVAARRVPFEILDYDQLHLPHSLSKIALLHQGLVLVAGITGSGKSTTIASMIEEINQTRPCHIITIEDPIEFLYKDKKAFINQREIGLDVANFHDALKYLMREDPDVVLIGEMRDEETFSAALQAAESGHLVFGTIHASGTASTITRVLELFPEDARDLVRSSLVFNLQAIICLKLLPGLRPDVPRVPAVEIMITNGTIRKLIGDKRDKDIHGVIRNSYHEGMIDFGESLRRLVEEEFISTKTAYDAAPNPEELKMRLKGIHVTGGGIIG
jgi:twitching motility protein PilT